MVKAKLIPEYSLKFSFFCATLYYALYNYMQNLSNINWFYIRNPQSGWAAVFV